LLRRLLLLRRSGKLGVIRGILQMYPRRRFLLVGDSGEHDPETYGSLARRHAGQIAGVFIRQLGGPGENRQRYAQAFRGVNPAIIKLYADATELVDCALPSIS
jgi:phosphatidate phosphatase APP1